MNKKQLNINVDELRDINCVCGNSFFSQLTRIKYVSPLQSPDGNSGLIRVVGHVCVECGKSDTDAIQNFERMQKEEFDSKVVHLKTN